MRFNFRRFAARPRLVSDWNEAQEELKVGWSELYVDLFMVAATNNVTHLLLAHPDAKGFGQFILLFTVFFNVWSSNAIYFTRIWLEGLAFDVLQLLYWLGVLGMVVSAQNFEWGPRFAGAYCVVRGVTLLYHAIAYATIPRARLASVIGAVWTGVLLALAIASTFAATTGAWVALFIPVAVLEQLQVMSQWPFPKARLPIHVEHAAERMGLIMMIFLGESIIAFGTTSIVNTGIQYAAIGLAAIVIWALHLIYFHVAPEQHDHAYRRSRITGIMFFYGHWLLGAAFLLTGTGLALALASYPAPSTSAASGTETAGGAEGAANGGHRRSLLAGGGGSSAGGATPTKGLEMGADGYIDSNVAWILCGGYSLALWVMAFIRATHYLSFDKDFHVWQLSNALNMKHYFVAWWLLTALWPLPSLFIAFAAGAMGATGLLAFLAAHGLVLNVLETYITHSISSHPDWRVIIEDASFHPSSSAGSAHKAAHSASSLHPSEGGSLTLMGRLSAASAPAAVGDGGGGGGKGAAAAAAAAGDGDVDGDDDIEKAATRAAAEAPAADGARAKGGGGGGAAAVAGEEEEEEPAVGAAGGGGGGDGACALGGVLHSADSIRRLRKVLRRKKCTQTAEVAIC